MSERPPFGAEDEASEEQKPEDLAADEIEEIDDVEEIEDEDEATEPVDESPLRPMLEAGAGEPEEVPCAYCGDMHPVGALRCRSCTGWLPVIEETVHKEHFFFLFCSFSLFIGTLLDWEWGLPGAAGILGGFLLVTSGYAMFASVVNIWYRRMIVWPHLTAMAIGLWAGWQRVVQLLNNAIKSGALEKKGEKFVHLKAYIDDLLHLFAPGLWIVVIISTALFIQLIVSIFVGGQRDAKRKAAEREARASARTERESRRK